MSNLEKLNNVKVLVLDVSYFPIGVISWEKAIYLSMSNKVEILDHYDLKINSVQQSFDCPAVVKVNWFSPKRLQVNFSRWSVLTRDNFSCAYCNNQFNPNELTLDHVIPFSKGGQRNWGNIITACTPCNHRKANRTPEQAGMPLHWNPYTPKWNPSFLLKFIGCGIQDKWRPWLSNFLEIS